MAAKRVSASTIDWVAFANRVPKNQKPQFSSFKSKSDSYSLKVSYLPESIPKINWDQYSKISAPGMVAEFQKQYEALKVPYPQDNYTSKINEVEKKAMDEVKKFVQDSEERIAKLREELEQWEKMIPISEMTLEEYAEHFPDKAISVDRPSLYPHTPETQPGYVHKEEAPH